MTKQFVTDLARKFNCETHYQGKNEIMFVKGEQFKEFIDSLQGYFQLSLLSFKIQETKAWPLPIESTIEDALGHTGIPPEALSEEKIVHTFANDNISFVSEDSPKEIPDVRDLLKESAKKNNDAMRKLIDEYLIDNPIDRTQKGCYNETAEKFGVTSDYVRDRYRKLRAKKLVENENPENVSQ